MIARKQYHVQQDYRGIYQQPGRGDGGMTGGCVFMVKGGLSLDLKEGATVALDEDVADWVNRDSPGTLVEVSS
jgi:hypothetical protein